ncbi:AraC family transcriptional regulator [Streptomyces sp. NBC_00237]|uniref:helix-turn-helix domain-containing protein n=1 Tax=Streptomyces sp. NBC_00237 TaxID=2975687 RepID=UPI00224E24EA|nr:AraC family transcriptional regulator [Streptomyces sp. NBC_00237]MCX5202900.1 AraC family transcriptional regulator [Streptomyces sp. NBC_00237]
MPVERRTHLDGEGLHLAGVRCEDPGCGWTAPRASEVFGLVLVRRGVFRSRVDGAERLIDPASVFVERAGREQQFAHPYGSDAYTEIVVDEPSLAALLGGDPRVPEGLAYCTPDVSFAHRVLLGRAAAGADHFELADLCTDLTVRILAQLAPERLASGRPRRTAAARTALVDAARGALAQDLGIGLTALGREVGCSPHHLSRIFRAGTGVPLARYRNRLRVERVLERLAQGETDLGGLAVESGFSDQSHMTRVVREAAGVPPGRIRGLLKGA